jgi:hypothetical protein
MFTKGDLLTCGNHVEALQVMLRSLWDVTIAGHRPGDPCPYQVGHSLTEHCVIGLGLFDDLDTFGTAIGRNMEERRR